MHSVTPAIFVFRERSSRYKHAIRIEYKLPVVRRVPFQNKELLLCADIKSCEAAGIWIRLRGRNSRT